MFVQRFTVGVIALMIFASQQVMADGDPAVDRFAALALECVHQEYPNKISHVLSGDQDVAPPRQTIHARTYGLQLLSPSNRC